MSKKINKLQAPDGTIYELADASVDGKLLNYLPLTGGILTGNEGYTIGLYPSNEDGQISEPSIEMNNKFGDSAYISPAAIDLTYGDNYTYMCAEEGNIGVENGSGSAKINPDNLQIKNSETDISISALEGEYGDITLQETVLDSSASLSSAGILSLQCADTELYASAEEGYIDFRNGDGNVVTVAPEYISVSNSNTEGGAELNQTELVLRNDDSSVTASLSIEDNGYLRLHSDETRYDIGLSVEEGAIYVTLNQDEEYCKLTPRNLILETATGSVSLDDSSIIANGAKLTFPTKTGTLALTSDLSSYFPLAGGTINGELVLNNSNEANVTNPPLTVIGYISGESGTTEVARIGAFENSPYGIVIKTDPNGTSYIQSQRFGSDTEFFNLSLNPWGGEVLVNGVKVATINDTNWLSTRLTALENSVVAVLSGTAEPTSDIGEDGDIYLVTE